MARRPSPPTHGAKIVSWKVQQGYGFIFYRGHRVFVHRTKLLPKATEKNEDLNDRWIEFSNKDIKTTRRKIMDANLKELIYQDVLELKAGTLHPKKS